MDVEHLSWLWQHMVCGGVALSTSYISQHTFHLEINNSGIKEGFIFIIHLGSAGDRNNKYLILFSEIVTVNYNLFLQEPPKIV